MNTHLHTYTHNFSFSLPHTHRRKICAASSQHGRASGASGRSQNPNISEHLCNKYLDFSTSVTWYNYIGGARQRWCLTLVSSCVIFDWKKGGGKKEEVPWDLWRVAVQGPLLPCAIWQRYRNQNILKFWTWCTLRLDMSGLFDIAFARVSTSGFGISPMIFRLLRSKSRMQSREGRFSFLLKMQKISFLFVYAYNSSEIIRQTNVKKRSLFVFVARLIGLLILFISSWYKSIGLHVISVKF